MTSTRQASRVQRLRSFKHADAGWFGQIPSDWGLSRLKWAATIREGQVDPHLEEFRELPLYAPNHIEAHTGRLLQVTSADDQGAESGKYLVEPGEVLYSKIRPALRKVAIAPARGLCSADVYPLKPRPGFDARFLFYSMLAEPFYRWSLLESDRVAMPKVNRQTLGDSWILAPRHAEQRAIAGFLDRKTAQLDELIAKKEQLIDLLVEKRTAVISLAVTKGLDPAVPKRESGVEWIGNVPAHWAVAPLFARYSVDLGKMLDAKWITGDSLLPYLRNIDVQWDHVNVEDLPKMDVFPDELERYTLREGDLLVCEGGEVGRTAMWRGELGLCAYQKAIHRLRPKSGSEIPRYFYYVMHAAASSQVFVAHGNPNTIPHLTAEQLRLYRFPFPPPDQQIAIAGHLDQVSNQVDRLTSEVLTAISRLREYRTALITAAVTGQIDARGEMA